MDIKTAIKAMAITRKTKGTTIILIKTVIIEK